MSVVTLHPAIQEVINSTLSESRRHERKGRLEEALACMQRISHQVQNPTVPNALAIVKRFTNLSIRIANKDRKAVLLRQAEALINSYIQTCSNSGQPLSEQVL